MSPTDGLSLVATRLVLGTGGWVGEAVDVACGLLVEGRDGPATVEVAGLHPGTPLSDAAPLLRAMLEEQGLPAPPVNPTDDEQYAYVEQAFGLGIVPLSEFYGRFLATVPAWEQQTPMQRSVLHLMDELDAEAEPERRSAIVERIRLAVANDRE